MLRSRNKRDCGKTTVQCEKTMSHRKDNKAKVTATKISSFFAGIFSAFGGPVALRFEDSVESEHGLSGEEGEDDEFYTDDDGLELIEDEGFLKTLYYFITLITMVIVLTILGSNNLGQDPPLSTSPQKMTYLDPPSLFMDSDNKSTPVKRQGAVPLAQSMFENADDHCVKYNGTCCSNNPELVERIITQGLDLDLLYTASKSLSDNPIDSESQPIKPSECRVPINSKEMDMSYLEDPIRVVTLKGKEAAQAPGTVIGELRKFGFQNVERHAGVNGHKRYRDLGYGRRRWPLEPGELGIRDSFLELFQNAVKYNYSRLWVFEDDALFQDNFLSTLDSVLHCQRCGQYMFSEDSGGVLLLGASDYAKEAQGSNSSPCYNTNMKTFGAFAVVYHRNVFERVVRWLTTNAYSHLPFDHIFGFLALEGYIVRVLSPPLVLPNILHLSSSSVTVRGWFKGVGIGSHFTRACNLHWNWTEFEYYRNFEEREHLQLNQDICQPESHHREMFKRTWQATFRIAVNSIAQFIRVARYLVEDWGHDLDGRNGLTGHAILMLTNGCEPKVWEDITLRLRPSQTPDSAQRSWEARLFEYSASQERNLLRDGMGSTTCTDEKVLAEFWNWYNTLIDAGVSIFWIGDSTTAAHEIARAASLHHYLYLHLNIELRTADMGPLPSAEEIVYSVEKFVSASTPEEATNLLKMHCSAPSVGGDGCDMWHLKSRQTEYESPLSYFGAI